jgi:dolichyl-phosphate-mannose--protein O-mannosyl transferase
MTPMRGVVLAAVIVVLIASAAVRLIRLDTPSGYIFDEVYYAKDAAFILDGKIGPRPGATWMPGDEVSWPHPYYGDLFIAAGISLFGDNAFGWRFMPALAGIFLLALVYPVARRLGLGRSWALLALVLAAADILGIAQSRIATLDIFLALWTVLTIYLTLRYIQSGRRVVWLLLAGLSAGLALGTKWSGALAALAALGLIAVLWRPRTDARLSVADRPGHGPTTEGEGVEEGDAAGSSAPTPRRARAAARSRRRDAAVTALLAILCLVLLPTALYVASYGVYFAAGHGLADWWHLQREMWTFNMNLDATHTYASLAPTWILDIRPVWYSFDEMATLYYGVVAMGHPVLWWTATLTLVALPVVAIVDRCRALVVPALLVALLYFPWFATTRTSFLYYMMPVAPFLAIMVTVGLARLAGVRPRLPDGHEDDPPVGRRSSRTKRRPPSSDVTDAALRGDAPGAGARWVWTAAEPGISPIESDNGLPTLPPAAPHPDRAAPGGIVAGLAAFLSAAALTALFWWPIGRLVATVFYEWPAGVAPAVGVAVATVAGAAALVALGWAASRPALAGAWRLVAWAFGGVVVGLAIAFAPIVLDIGTDPDRFYRLMWLPTWI